MQITQEQLDFIDKYFTSDLTPEEEIIFNRKIKEDKDFKEAFSFMQLMEQSIRNSDRNEKLELLKNYELEKYGKLESEIQNSKSKIKTLNRWIIPISSIAVASIVFIVGFSSLFNSTTKTDIIFDKYFEAPPSHVLKRSTSQNLSKVKQNAFALYGIDEFTSSGPLLDDLCKNGDQQSCLYAAISFIASNQYNKAQLLFDRKNFLPNTDPNIIKWYQALLYIKQEELNKATKILTNLSSSEHQFTEDAKLILVELKSIK